MKIYEKLYARMRDVGLGVWADVLPEQLAEALSVARNSNLPGWLAVAEWIRALDRCTPEVTDGLLSFGDGAQFDDETLRLLEDKLRQLHPWRKGPFSIHGIHIDTEWRSDWKWDRLKDAISPLSGKTVLDVGSGNGYHCWRMADAGASLAIGVEPYMVSIVQFLAMNALTDQDKVFVLPRRIEDIPGGLAAFDTVFSMGLLYHRKSPIDHLFELRDCLKPGGELVLETLVIEGGAGQVLVPEDRYARMRNVWFIPTPDTLVAWMERVGFVDVRVVDVTPTTVEEQRSTGWMQLESLTNSLEPEDPSRTIEGYPAPIRSVIIGNKRS